MKPTATIYHNPQCGTSRKVLQTLQEAGFDIEIIEYMKTGWTPALLQSLLKETHLSAHELLRGKSAPAEELDLLGENVSEDAILKAMLEHPVLVNRPIVRTAKGTALCRPSEKVLEII